MNWKIGDRAICITPGSKMNGCEVVIISDLNEFICGKTFKHFHGHDVDPGFPPPPYGIAWATQPKYLIPIKDNYDGLELTKWSECPWQPEKVTVCL